MDTIYVPPDVSSFVIEQSDDLMILPCTAASTTGSSVIIQPNRAPKNGSRIYVFDFQGNATGYNITFNNFLGFMKPGTGPIGPSLVMATNWEWWEMTYVAAMNYWMVTGYNGDW
jgi:hypothetical protein